MTTERWTRDDGWSWLIEVYEDGTCLPEHLPMIVTPPPTPLTYEYVTTAFRAHGYLRDDV